MEGGEGAPCELFGKSINKIYVKTGVQTNLQRSKILKIGQKKCSPSKFFYSQI